MNLTEKIILGIIIATLITSLALYQIMPDSTASHWNINGEANGYLPKFWDLFLMPIISIGLLLLLFIYAPRIDPLKANIKKFRK
jgi:uncharacterized membrane protein